MKFKSTLLAVILIFASASLLAFPMKNGVYHGIGEKWAPDGTVIRNSTTWTFSEDLTKVTRVEDIKGSGIWTMIFYLDHQDNGYLEIYVKIPEVGDVVIGNGMCKKDWCHSRFEIAHPDEGYVEEVNDTIIKLGNGVVRKMGTSRDRDTGEIFTSYSETLQFIPKYAQ